MNYIEYNMDFISSDEVLYWQRRTSDIICEALENLCGKKFSNHPIIIKKQECYVGETGKYYVSLDECHDITHIYDANQEIYHIPEIKVLLEEREQCYNMIQETKATLTIIEKETFHLGNIRYLDQVIEKLFRERVEEIPKLNETIYRNNERIKKIKKELTIVFAEFLRRHD